MKHRSSRERGLGRLVARYGLDSQASGQLEALLRVLTQDPLAPTTIRDPQRAIDDHLADSLVGLELDVVKNADTIADLGSGAGLPGLPLAIALPSAHVTLVESNGRKAEFLGRAAELCRLQNVTVVAKRAEILGHDAAKFALVTARALASLTVLAEYAAPLLRMGGSLVAWRGRRDPDEEAAAARAADELGLIPAEPVHVQPYPGADHRHLQVLAKVSTTPARFPRRPGMAQKRPLGSPPRRAV